MVQPIWGPSQMIQGPIQRSFGPSFILWVYRLRKFTESHDMQAECQRINNSHSFLTVPFIDHKPPVIDWSLALQSLKNWSPIAPQLILSLMRMCCWTSSFPQRLKNWTLIQIYPFLILLPIQWTNLQFFPRLISIRLTLQPQPTKLSDSSAESRETFLSTYHHKSQKVQNTTVILFIIYIDEPLATTYEKLTHVLISWYHFDIIFIWWDRSD